MKRLSRAEMLRWHEMEILELLNSGRAHGGTKTFFSVRLDFKNDFFFIIQLNSIIFIDLNETLCVLSL